MDDEELGLLSQAILGEQADMFFKSDLGKFVLGLALQDSEEAQEKLSNVSPFKFWRVHQYQQALKSVKQSLAWLNDALIEGRHAKNIIEQEKQTGE